MIKDRNTTIGLFVASFVVQVLLNNIKGEQFEIAGILGGTISLMLLPYLVTLLIKGTNKLLSREFSEKAFFVTFLTVYIIFVLAGLVTSNFEKSNISGRQAQDQSRFTYSPRGCLYEIKFKYLPKINELSTTDGKRVLKAEVAELVMNEDNGYVKSEFFVFSKDTLDHINNDVLYDLLKVYAINNGFDNPQFQKFNTELGSQVHLRAYKTLKDDKLKERHLIMTAHLYSKGNNILILYAASEAKDYPTPEITKFTNSISLKN